MSQFTRRQFLASSGAAVGTGLLLPRPAGATTPPYGVVIYGGTPSGVIAAYAAAEQGLRVALVLGTSPLGGMCAQGLGFTDAGNWHVIGGLALQFFQRVGQAYGKTVPVWQFEPHVAEAVFAGMLQEAGVEVYPTGVLAGVAKVGATLTGIRLSDGTSLTGSSFIDASYEGDLMAAAGASYRVGREAQSEYQEYFAGFDTRPTILPVSPYDGQGRLLPGIRPYPAVAPGAADLGLQSYTFRLCLSDEKPNMLPFAKPADYDPRLYTAFIRQLLPTDVFEPGALPNHKFDLNGDYPGASWGYPEADLAGRGHLWRLHYDYFTGLLYFLGHDPSVPAAYREQVNLYGLAKDEFVATGHWPRQLYIREARRLVGQTVMVERDVQIHVVRPHPIGMGSYNLDCHIVQVLATADGQLDQEGTFVPRNLAATKPYQIPFSTLVPNPAEVENLLVTVCVSASHVAYCSLRLEPQYMIMGQAAGAAAAVALQQKTPFHRLGAAVSAALAGAGVVMSL